MSDLFSKKPRGIRNNNWLNIKYNPRSKWQGLAGNDGTFCIFKTPEYGIRAANKILRNYIKGYPNIDVEHMIKKWCPDDTADAYVRYVCRVAGVLPYTYLSMFIGNNFYMYVNVLGAMAQMECGKVFLPNDYKNVIMRGLSMKL